MMGNSESMKDSELIQDFLARYEQALMKTDVSDLLINMKQELLKLHENGNKVIIAGNGGSAAMASHVSVDFTKQGRVRTVNFNEADLITCFTNDYGFEHWISKALEVYADTGDMVILISSSGSSVNMINAAHMARKLGLRVVTFTGFKEENPLKQLGDVNFWLDSKAYNIIENTHQIWLLMLCDLLVGSAEYSA
jgi:D-sedoheptulose 7-phosphate isomerase